ncbi:MAG: hypothetical protein NVS3B12_24530 [Acidimicrobiales bacterium]
MPDVHDLLLASGPVAAARLRLLDRASGATLSVGAGRDIPGASSVVSWEDSTVLDDGSFGTIVCVASLCRISDQVTFIAGLRRLLNPGGTLLFLEHVRGPHPVSQLQRLYSPGWSVMAAGCRLDRDTVAAIRQAGFVVCDLERLAPLGRMSAGTAVAGRAIARLPIDTTTAPSRSDAPPSPLPPVQEDH